MQHTIQALRTSANLRAAGLAPRRAGRMLRGLWLSALNVRTVEVTSSVRGGLGLLLGSRIGERMTLLQQHPHPAESGSLLLVDGGRSAATPAMRGSDGGTFPAPRAGGIPGAWGRLARFVLPGATLALIAIEAPAVAPYVGRAAHSLGKADLRWLLVAVVAELWSMVLFARLQRRMLSAGGTRVPLRAVIGLSYAANAMSRTLPGGSALSSTYAFHRLRGLGASVPLAGFTLAASGILSTAAFTLLGLTAGVATGAGSLSPATWTAGIVAAVLAVYLARHVTSGTTFPQRSLGLVLGWSDRVRRRPAGSGGGRRA